MGDTEGRKTKAWKLKSFSHKSGVPVMVPLRIFGKGPLFSYRKSRVVDLSLFLHIEWTPGKFFISFACIFSSIDLTSDHTNSQGGQELRTESAVSNTSQKLPL